MSMKVYAMTIIKQHSEPDVSILIDGNGSDGALLMIADGTEDEEKMVAIKPHRPEEVNFAAVVLKKWFGGDEMEHRKVIEMFK